MRILSTHSGINRTIRVDLDGVASYIKDGIHNIVRVDLDAYSEYFFWYRFWIVFGVLPVVDQRKKIDGCIHRAPGFDLHLFNNKCDQLIRKISSESPDLFLVGNHNINLLDYEFEKGTADYTADLYFRLYFPFINRPAWLTELRLQGMIT